MRSTRGRDDLRRAAGNQLPRIKEENKERCSPREKAAIWLVVGLQDCALLSMGVLLRKIERCPYSAVAYILRRRVYNDWFVVVVFLRKQGQLANVCNETYYN